MSAPLLALEKVSKLYRRGLLDRTPAFQLDVDHTRQDRFPGRPEELLCGVLQTEREQNEDQPDLRAELDEAVRRDQGDDAALAEREAGEQIEGRGREVEPGCHAGEHREADDHGAQLEESHDDEPRAEPSIDRVYAWIRTTVPRGTFSMRNRKSTSDACRQPLDTAWPHVGVGEP